MSNNFSYSRLTLGGLLIAITVIFQAAPLFFPGLGAFLSLLSTLPVAVAVAASGIRIGILVWAVSVILLQTINPLLSFILLFTTGPLGLSIGLSCHSRALYKNLIATTAILFVGMVFLIRLVGLGSFTYFMLPKYILAVIILVCCLVYSFLWIAFFKEFIKKLKLDQK